MTKKTKSSTETDAIEPDQLLARSRASISKALEALDGCVDALSKKLGGKSTKKTYDRDSASHLAWVTKQISQIMGEVRKLEDHERTTAAKLSPQLVMAHLRGLPQERRAHIVRELVAMDVEGSVLA